MSINEKQQVKCPKCGQLTELTVWQSITVSDSPDLKDDLLKGKINMFRCPSCGLSALMPTPLLYTDDKKKLMISFSPCENESDKIAMYEKIKSTSKDTVNALSDYNLRFISSYNDFLEKVLIYDNGFHDKVIEVLKLLVLMQDEENMEHRVCMFGKYENNELEFLVQDKRENKLYTSRVPMSTYETVKEQLRQSGVKYKSFDWEIVDSEYAARLLRGYNNTL